MLLNEDNILNMNASLPYGPQVKSYCKFISDIQEKQMSRVMRKQDFAYAKTKTQISLAVNANLISAFVFATQIVQSLTFLTRNFKPRTCTAGFVSDQVGNQNVGFLMTRLKYVLQVISVQSVGSVTLMMTGNPRWSSVACVRAGCMPGVRDSQVSC